MSEGFTSVEGWVAGDKLVDFRGDSATLISVTRQNSEGRSAKVLTDGHGAGTAHEFYADVYTNTSLEGRLLEAAANKLGAEAGTAAGTWYEVDSSSAERVLLGIDEGDPEVLDTLPSCDLSGQLADVPGSEDVLRSIYSEAGVEWSILAEADLYRSDTLDIYEIAFNDAACEEVVRQARYHQSTNEEVR